MKTKLIEDPYVKLIGTYIVTVTTTNGCNFDVDKIEEDKFIDWVKSLSQSDVEHIETMCLEKEQYEYIGLVLGIKNGTYGN